MSDEKKAWSTPRISINPSADALLARYRGVALNPTDQKTLDRFAIEMRRNHSRSAAA
jgi:hypothetical protein